MVGAVTLLAPVLGLACGGAEGGGRGGVEPAVDTVAGVVVVRNGANGGWGPGEGWTMTEALRVPLPSADVETPYADRLTSVAVGPGGRIAILDFLMREVILLEADGSLVRRFGGLGEGDGELSSPTALAWDGQGRLWVADSYVGRYALFDSAGAWLGSVPRPVRSVARLQHALVLESGGSLVDESAQGGGVRFVRVDGTGTVTDSLAFLPQPRTSLLERLFTLPEQDAFKHVVRYYRPKLRWSLAPEGTVWMARSGELTLIQLDLATGDTLRVVHTAHRRPPLTDEDEEAIRRGLAEVGVERAELELVRPVVQSVHVLEDGFVLVQVVDEVGVEASTFDVFDPSGDYLGSVDAGFGTSELGIPALVGDTIVAVARGADDAPWVVKAAIRRRAPE